MTVRTSVSSALIEGDGHSVIGSISADGRYVVFESNSTDIAPIHVYGGWDVFLHDRLAGQTTLLSVGPNGEHQLPPWAPGRSPTISADGRHVVFETGTSLIQADTNSTHDLYIRDGHTGVTSLVSVGSSGAQADGVCTAPSVSADGRWVAFQSSSQNLTGFNPSAMLHVYVRDVVTGTTSRVSVSSTGVAANAACNAAAISGDGRFIAFESAANNLVAGDTNQASDVFLHDRVTGVTVRASVATSGTQATGASRNASVSNDGRYVAFESAATDLVAGDTNGSGVFGTDVFVHDRVTGATTRVSIASSGAQANNPSFEASLSGDGRYVAFSSLATNLVAGDNNGVSDVFVHDRQSALTIRVSVTAAGAQANSASSLPVISADGRFVAFQSLAVNLVPGDSNARQDVFVRDRFESGLDFCSPGEGGTLACPCGGGTQAPHAPGHGCSNSVANAGGRLTATGTPVVGGDTLVLRASGVAHGMLLFVAGQGYDSGSAFGDGVRCVTGPLTHFGAMLPFGNEGWYPDDGGDAPISLATNAPAASTRYYQAYYRNAASWCNAAKFNVTNATSVTWQ